MVTFLLAVIGLLLGVIAYQYHFIKSRSAHLREIGHKLRRILETKTSEKLLAVTDDAVIRSLLVEMNHLLEYTRKTISDYTKTEIAMKKMISNISHDLKTPLTVILGYIETIHMDKQMSEDERTELLAKVYKKTMEVLDLIHKFFDLAKLESGDQEIAMTRLNLSEVCRQNILMFYDVLTAKGFDVRIDIPDEPVFVMGNEDALNRIMNNLISNAIHHGGAGAVVGLALKMKDELVVLEVWDRGKGIHEQHKDRVFERMFTLEDSRNRSNRNSGLGLTITKRLVEKMEGTISLYSRPYEKTVFSIRFKRIRY